tara:strand:+ start:185 stop:781 length:597 start_codon:yes stop_codon:yes gene_type:complete
MAQSKGKYWLAGHSDSEITYDEVKELATISETDFGVVSDLTVTANEINKGVGIHTSVTALTAAGALAANTTYHLNDTDAAAYTLPAAASSTVGDKIVVLYIAALADSAVHKYGTAGEFFAATSYVLKQTAVAAGAGYTIDIADGTGDDFLNLTGATNGGWGIGTKLTFVFNGSKWHVECVGGNQGNGGSAATGAFATT